MGWSDIRLAESEIIGFARTYIDGKLLRRNCNI